MELTNNIRDWLFHRDRVANQRTLEKYTAVLLKTKVDLFHLSQLLPYLLVKTMQIKNASVAVLDSAAHNFRLYSAGKELKSSTIAANSTLIKELLKRKTELNLSFEENEDLIKEMIRLETILAIPGFKTAEELLMVFNLGQLKTNQDYSPDEVSYYKHYVNRVISQIAP